MGRVVPRVSTGRMKVLAQMLEEIDYEALSAWTAVALELHDYQYNGPDPDLALSKYRSRREAAVDVKLLIEELTKRIEELKPRVRWSNDLEEALNEPRKNPTKDKQ
ncbi:hypothetical protein Vsou_18050 [Vulcanisaeta souniana JCM 11219]|uniref:PaREP1 family protein n=1 Tax=Vulcanisaeta souniana JCM 11219 TaxID=1293586 RepID=A0A830E5H3_9CREN|nr:hypothetical protein Vsou_18050 [Vulcanisaeta souniana JCM 11219]GGI84235.1 hypothetical protein GCM10007112_21460 [Vulcanisaeta souniana JCM 11219]